MRASRLEPVFGDQSGQIGGSARGDREALQILEIERQFERNFNASGGEVHVMSERPTDDFGLLMDFLRHEMAMIALVGEEGTGGDLVPRPVYRVAGLIVDIDVSASEDRPVAVIEIGHLVGEGRERQGIRAEIILAVTVPDRQGSAVTRADHQIVLAGEDERQGEGATEARQCHGDRLDRSPALVHFIGDELRHDFGVGLGLEPDALCLEAGFQLAEILDDAVMNHREFVGRMRMRIRLVGLSVGRPAGVANPDQAGQRRLVEFRLKVSQFALGPAAVEPALIEGGDAG